jgi:hypothetical protein
MSAASITCTLSRRADFGWGRGLTGRAAPPRRALSDDEAEGTVADLVVGVGTERAVGIEGRRRRPEREGSSPVAFSGKRVGIGRPGAHGPVGGARLGCAK